ncbi:hypothetical protein FB192DRAFT_1292283 [Mucor lusitanicus]|nr:hypothetical protein FB192DRAFT_1292283 [Mucor lusitanicus]
MKVVSDQSVTLQSKGTDSSLRLTFQITSANYPLIFYFLKFFRGGTSHRVEESLNVSAYTFDDSNKAFASVRVGGSSVSPIREIDHNNNLIGVDFGACVMPVNDLAFTSSREHKKCRFVIMKYVWDHWADERPVEGKKDSLRESASDNLEDFYDDMCK